MSVSKEILRAVLRDKRLKTNFLKRVQLSEDALNISILLGTEGIEEFLVSSMLEEYLDFTYEYPHPINPLAQVMNPIRIVGVKGAYLVVEDYQEINRIFTMFSDKVKAIKYANEGYERFLIKTKLKNGGKGLKPYRN